MTGLTYCREHTVQMSTTTSLSSSVSFSPNWSVHLPSVIGPEINKDASNICLHFLFVLFLFPAKPLLSYYLSLSPLFTDTRRRLTTLRRKKSTNVTDFINQLSCVFSYSFGIVSSGSCSLCNYCKSSLNWLTTSYTLGR